MKKLILALSLSFLLCPNGFAWPTFDIDSFLGMKDTPDSYLGESGNCVAVNGTETGLEFTSCGVGGGGAPTGASYLTLGLHGSLSAERVLTEGTYLDFADTGANGTLTLSLDPTEMEAVTFGAGGNASNIWTFDLSGTDPTITASSGTIGIGGALTSNTLNTGQGAYELYAMDQNVLTTSSPTFAGVTFTGDAEFGNTPQSIDGGTQGLAFDPDNDGTNEATIDTTGMISADGGFTAGASTDPGIVFDVVTSSDTDWWQAVNEDAGGDDDDTLEIGTGTTKLTNTRLTLDGSGNITTYNQSDLRFSDSDSSNYGAIQAPATIGANYTLTLPDTDGDADQYLKTNGSGVLSWATVSGGTISGTDTHVMFFDGTDTPAGDAGFTYNKTTDSATLVGDLTLNGHDLVMGTTSAGVTLTDDGDGALTIAAKGDGSQENLTINLDDTANTAQFSTSTGVNSINLGTDASPMSLVIPTDGYAQFGLTGFNALIGWETLNTRDDLQIGVRVGADSISGHVSIMERDDMANSNRQPPNASNDPALLLWSADAGSATDYIRIRHDQTNGEIDLGTGDLNILDPVSVTGTLTASGKVTANASLDVKNGATSSGVLAIFEDSDDGTNKATFQVPALAADTVYTLPNNDGDASQFLQTDGNGVLTWATSAGSGDITDVGDCTNGACFTGASGTLLQSNTDLIMELDNDNNGTESFQVKDGGDTLVAEIEESGLIKTLVGLDAIGAVDMDYGSADVTDHAFITDGTGDAEVVLPDQSISSTEILNDTITTSDLNATLTFSDGDLLDFGTNISSATEGILIPAHATSCASATAEGQVCWEEDADNLWIGDGAAAKQMNTGGSKPPREYYWPASALLPLEHGADSIPPIDKNAGTNVDILTRLFDSGTDECVSGTLLVPSDVNTSGTVTLRTKGFASTASCAGGSCEIIMDFRHVDRDDAETFDATLTTVADGACTISSTANTLTECTWTETITNLSWEASDTIEFEVCRDANNASDDLAGDFEMLDFSVEIPRA